MAKMLERSSNLYDADLLAWLEQQAGYLRANQLDRLNVVHLIEELEDMGGASDVSSRAGWNPSHAHVEAGCAAAAPLAQLACGTALSVGRDPGRRAGPRAN